MTLNIPRIEMKPAVAVLRGSAALGVHRLGREWADAIAFDRSQVDAILADANAKRDMARLRPRPGVSPW